MPLVDLLLVTAFAASMVGTPGPANMLMFASGFNFGYRNTLPFMLGTIGGFQIVNLAGAAGLGSLLVAWPGVFTILKLISVGYIIFLAVKIVLARPEVAESVQRWNFMQGLAVHPLNPKAYAMIIAGYVTFAGNGDDYLPRAIAIFLVFFLVGFPLNSLWVLGGGLMRTHIAESRTIRRVNLILALTMVAVVVYASWLI